MLINTHHVVINETRWNIIKVEVSNISIIITEDGPKSVSERDLSGLQYIGSYMECKSHNNFRNHKN